MFKCSKNSLIYAIKTNFTLTFLRFKFLRFMEISISFIRVLVHQIIIYYR